MDGFTFDSEEKKLSVVIFFIGVTLIVLSFIATPEWGYYFGNRIVTIFLGSLSLVTSSLYFYFYLTENKTNERLNTEKV